jgi:hypothetical protein
MKSLILQVAFAMLLSPWWALGLELPDAPSRSQANESHPDKAGSQAEKPKASAHETAVAPNREGYHRILGVIPAFGVTDRQDAPALTPKQKFLLFAREAYDPFSWFAAGLQAGIGQANNEFPEYGQGAEGYGKRYGAALLDTASSGFFANFAYPVLLKQDPRYFRLGEGTFKRRMFYSLKQEFSARTDKGIRQVNWSNILGAFTAGGISNAYYPSSDRGFGLTVSRSAISLMYGMVGGLGEEFWPDIHRKLFHKRQQETTGRSQP